MLSRSFALYVFAAFLACDSAVARHHRHRYYSHSHSSSLQSTTDGKHSTTAVTVGGSPTSSSASPSSVFTAPTAGQTNIAAASPYKLIRSYEGESFFDGWDFFTEEDPTEGQVEYVTRAVAEANGLISTDGGSAIMRVDNKSQLGKGERRKSVRIESSEPAEIGSLVLADIARMPWGCAVWPAWWSYGEPGWPEGGEIDVIEGVNLDLQNVITLHTKGDGCSLPAKPDVLGALLPDNTVCDVDVTYSGCSYTGGKNSFGESFNAAGGAVMATLFTEDEISVWYFPRAKVPQNVKDGSPDVSSWGKPTATWKKDSCDIARMFSAQRLIFDITLCGSYAGNDEVWNMSCASKSATCSDHVRTASNFEEAVWEIKSVKVYSTA